MDDLPGDRAVARARGRFHVYRDALRGGWRAGGVGWADQPEPPDDGRPVIELFRTAAFPARLWVYSNFTDTWPATTA
ncbi:MAG: hypothetical protein M3Y17_02170 [Actinomycetota bacterium]|nr:hypothetical protein [Actinomycetota bacterium]